MSQLVFREDNDKPLPPILNQVLTAEGWSQYDEEIPPEEQPKYNLFWKTNRFFPSQIQACKYPYQRVNHYPKSSEITRKDAMYRHLKRMKGVYGGIYNFVPTTFVLPNEYVKFCKYFADERDTAQRAGKRNPMYICKPTDLSRGRKIFTFDDIGDLTYDCASVVQKYIANPLLIKGHKFDLRIYVLVTSFQPLRAYIFDDFLARFGVERFDVEDVRNIFAHLTNYSISKTSQNTDDAVMSGIGALCKWESKRFKEYFAAAGIDFDHIWRRIENLVCLTLLSIANQVPSIPQCFELYGFDVLLDEKFQPWLVEVNFSPALAVESDVDYKVKFPLIRDLVNTLNIPVFPEEGQEDEADTTPEQQQQPPVVERRDEPVVSARGKSAQDAEQQQESGDAEEQPSSKAGSSPPPESEREDKADPAESKTAKPAARQPIWARSTATKTGTVRQAAGPSTSGTAPRRAGNSGGGPRNASTTAASRQAQTARTPGNAVGSGAAVASLRRRNSNTNMTSKTASDVTARLAGTKKVVVEQGTKWVDKPSGQFRWVFPFSPETEAASVEMGRTQSEPLLRQLVGEVKKRESAAIAAMKDFPAKYAAYINDKAYSSK